MNHSALKGIAIEGKYDVDQDLKRCLLQDNEVSELILFTPNSQRKVIRSLLENSEIKIYSLDYLYMLIYNYSTDLDDIPISIAEDALNISLYDYDLFPACFFHQKYAEDSSKYCALSEAKRCCYNMCLHLDIKTRFGIEPIIGKHFPGNVRSGERISCVLPSAMPGFITNCNDTGIDKLKRKPVKSKKSQERNEESVSENFDQLSLISDVTESSTSVLLPHGRIGNEGVPAGLNLLRGAWASPSTISSVKTADEDEFPTLGASSFRRDSEGAKPVGFVKQSSTQPNVGLQGFGRGKPFAKKLNN